MKARTGVINARERAVRPPGRPAMFNRFMVGVNIEQEYLFKMREINRSELINSLLKKHFDEEETRTVQPND